MTLLKVRLNIVVVGKNDFDVKNTPNPKQTVWVQCFDFKNNTKSSRAPIVFC